MIRKLMASSAILALMSAGAMTIAQAQTDPAAPPVVDSQAVVQDNSTNATPVTELAASEQTLTPEQPTLATAFIGRSVYSSEDPESDNIGDVNDLIVGEDGTISHAVIGVGGFLGMGEKDVAVPFDELQVVERDGDIRLIYSATREQLEAAPAFDRTAYDPSARAAEQQAASADATEPADPMAPMAPAASTDLTAAPAPAVESTTADNNAAMQPAAGTESFVQTAAIANLFEIQSSQSAVEKAENADVKAFAQRMIDDHTKAGEDLKAAAESENSGVAVPDALDQQHQDQLAALDAATGADFDRQYVDMQVKAHDEAVKLFETYASDGQDGAVKTFAQNTLPTLQDHQKMIRDISDNLGANTAMSNEQAPAADVTAANEVAAPATTDMTAAPAEQGPVEVFVAAAPDQIRASTLIGKSIYGPGEESIGEVSDIVFQKESGARAALIDVGGFLGIGEKTVAIPFTDLQFKQIVDTTAAPVTTAPSTDVAAPADTAATETPVDNNDVADMRVTVAMTRDQIEQLPAFDASTVDTAATDTTVAPASADQAATTPPVDPNVTAEVPAAGADQITTGSVGLSQDIAASDLIGATVYGTDDANIGEVNDIVFAPQGDIDAVLVDVGGFLGIGEKSVALNVDQLNVRTDESGTLSVVVSATKDQLDQAQAYQAAAQ